MDFYSEARQQNIRILRDTDIYILEFRVSGRQKICVCCATIARVADALNNYLDESQIDTVQRYFAG